MGFTMLLKGSLDSNVQRDQVEGLSHGPGGWMVRDRFFSLATTLDADTRCSQERMAVHRFGLSEMKIYTLTLDWVATVRG